MHDETSPIIESIHLTAKEQEFIRTMRENKILSDRFSHLLQRYKQEIEDGMDAHHAEETIIEELQNLGKSMMSEWAEKAEEKALQNLDPSHQKHSKKKSLGTPPSE